MIKLAFVLSFVLALITAGYYAAEHGLLSGPAVSGLFVPGFVFIMASAVILGLVKRPPVGLLAASAGTMAVLSCWALTGSYLALFLAPTVWPAVFWLVICVLVAAIAAVQLKKCSVRLGIRYLWAGLAGMIVTLAAGVTVIHGDWQPSAVAVAALGLLALASRKYPKAFNV